MDVEDVDFPIPDVPALGSELEGELGKLQPVVTRRPLRQLAMLVGISLVYGATLLAVFTLRRDLHELPIAFVLAAGAAWLLGFVVPAYLAIVPRKGSALPRWKLGAVAAVITSIGFVVLGLTVHPSGPSSLDFSETVLRGHWCLEIGVGIAIVPVVIGAVFVRGALPVGARWTAAALGAAGGAFAGLLLHLHCPIADKWHVGIIHGAVVVVSAALAAALVPRISSRDA